MSRSNWRFFGRWITIYGVLALALVLPRSAFSQEAKREIKMDPEVIDGEVRLDQELQGFQAAQTQLQQHQEMFRQQRAHMQAEREAFHKEKGKLARALQEAHREIEQHHRTSMPPFEETQTRVFHLKHLDARRLEDTLGKIIGPESLRLARWGSSKMVMIRAKTNTLNRVKSLIAEIDIPEVESKTENPSDLPQSLMVRIFWLSDGETSQNIQPAERFLPDSVINALQRVGIERPFVVLQSNTSITLQEGENFTQFEVENLPAIVGDDQLRFSAQGNVRPAGRDRIYFSMETCTSRTSSKRQIEENRIKGSMIAPLDHFVVLGTANHASSKPNNSGTHSSSRFAFVVQMVEAESFAPEK